MRSRTFRCLMATAAAFLVTVPVLMPQSKPVTAIKAGKLIDTEDGRVLANQVILVEDGR